LEGLGEFKTGVDISNGLHYLLVSTNYSIPNKDLAESELNSLK